MRNRTTMLLIILLPALGTSGGWAELGKPFGNDGMWGFTAAGLLAGLMLPALLVSARSLPLLLIPKSTLRWWRHRQSERGRGRPHIPAWLRRTVYFVDGYRCRWCGDATDLQLDHIRPWCFGGLTVLWNLVTLCGTCNKVKSNCWVWRDDYVSYHAWPGYSDQDEALQILAWEKLHRWSPLRWMLATFAIGRA